MLATLHILLIEQLKCVFQFVQVLLPYMLILILKHVFRSVKIIQFNLNIYLSEPADLTAQPIIIGII